VCAPPQVLTARLAGGSPRVGGLSGSPCGAFDAGSDPARFHGSGFLVVGWLIVVVLGLVALMRLVA
jgi:hypothetical protein